MENNKLNEVKSMFDENKRNFTIGIVVFFVLIAIIFIAINKKRNESEHLSIKVEGCKPGDMFSETTGKPCSGEEIPVCKDGDLYNINTGELCKGAESKKTNSDSYNLGYESALKKYSGQSLVFNENCESTPQTLEAKVGDAILVANNSKINLEFGIKNRTTKLNSYHYLLHFIDSTGDINVACNGNEVAKVVVR